MSKIIPAYDPKVRKGVYKFHCPGCDEEHYVNTSRENKGPCWGFNGDVDKPTFTPSVLVKVGHYVDGQPQPPDCSQCNYVSEDGESWPWGCSRCHSFVKDGNIQFLNDCSHDLAGKTVPLPDIA